MAGRFVIHKFSFGMSRSTSLLGRHVSASAARAAGAPVTQTASDCGTRHISNALHGAALRPGMTIPNNHGIHGFAARFPCPRPAAAETSQPTTGMPSIIMNRTTPTFVDSLTGSKRGFSSTASNKHKPSEKAKMAPQKSKVKYERVHDSTSFVLNSFAILVMGFGLFVAANDN
ncbi:unnamed protein product [Urochloa humidicola]